MGRHRLHAAPPSGSKRRTVVRNGLLGVSVAVVLGTAAVTTGLVPVGDSFPYVGTDSGSKTEAKASPTPDAGRSLQQQGGLAGLPGRAVPSAEASSASPTPSASASASPSPTPTPTPTASSKAPEPAKTTAAPKPAAPKPVAPKPVAPKPVVPVPATGDGHSSEAAAVLTLVNQVRAQAGCGPVRANPPLASLAAAFSKDMAVRGFFDHTDPDGRTPWDRAQAAGISGLGGENIARGQGDAASVMNAWMNSPGHKANILNCEFRTLGVGAYFGAGGPWWTQDFGF